MLAALTVALSLLAGPPQSSIAYGPEPVGSAADAPPADAGEREAAKLEFDRGLEAVANHEYELAVTAFERAYALRPHPVTLFNLALALEKAERLPEAWELFDDVVEIVESDAERREVRRHMREIASEIAIVEINADPQTRLCLDGTAMPTTPDDTSDYRLAVEPGPHSLLIDDQELELEFVAGDRRVLLLEDADALVDGRRRGPLQPAMLGLSIGSGVLALGFGIGASVADRDSAQTGLAAAAATGAGIAVAAGIVALLIETRTITDPTGRRPPAGQYCPGSTERRLDLELGPMVDRPETFASAPLGRPLPTAVDPGFPHPRSIAPGRATTQNRPTTTSPM
jgi:hypothetical protein